MPAFSVISQDPTIRALVQDGMLERAFHDALFPALLFRADVEPILYPGNVGDTRIFSGKGLITPTLSPLVPGQDPLPVNVQYEQWTATMQKWASTIDTYMPNSIVDIADLFMENAMSLGLHSGQSMNRIVRDFSYNAAMAGNTVCDTGATAATSIHVARLNGFTLARRPDLAAGSPVQFQAVSTNNPLQITVYDSSGNPQATTVTAYTPDNVGDQIGPGTLTLSAAVTCAARGPVKASNASFIVRSSGGNSVDTLTSSTLFRLQDIRSALARFRLMNVRPQASGFFHCHLDPTSEGQLFGDQELTRLMTSLPDSFVYQEFAIGRLLGTVFLRNAECPLATTVIGGATNAYVGGSAGEPFGGEIYTNGTSYATSGIPVHRPLFSGMGAIKEYYMNMSDLITEAGVTGKVGEPKVTADGIEVNTDRIQLIFRSPQDRLQELVSISWKFYGAYAVRTDVTTGDGAAFKRFLVVEHGE